MSLLEQDITRNERVKKVPELDANDNSKKYKVEANWDSAVYVKESESHLPGFYHLVAWKGYPEEENTWEPVLAVQYLRKLISFFYKGHLEKPTANSLPVNSAPLIARPTAKPARPIIKQKRGQLANNANKWAKKNWTFCSFSHITSARPWLFSFIKKHRFSSSKSFLSR